MTSDQKSLKIEILEKIMDLMIAGFGLVAALAWNDAIKALFSLVFPQASNVIAQFIYAILITIIMVVITVKLGKFLEFSKKQLDKNTKKTWQIA